MPIVAADLIVLGSASRPEDDTSTVGGASDVDHRPVFTAMAANDTLEILSDNAGDTTQQLTITGRAATGEQQSDTKTLSGTTPVAVTGTFERMLKVVMDSDAVGTVTVRRATGAITIGTIPVGERGFYRMYIDSTSEASQAIRYEKLFWKNTHATLSLTASTVELTADPASRIRMGIAATIDDSVTATNRKTAPGGITFVDDSVAQSVPSGGALAAGEAVGVWIEQDLPADDPVHKTSFTTQLAGSTV